MSADTAIESPPLVANRDAMAPSGDFKTPLTEQAYQLIRNRILKGDMAAGEKLKIDTLQRDMRISSSPLREALNRLVAENLVIADDRRGFRVSPLTIGDLVDLTSTRIVVEPGALVAAMKHGSDVWEAQIVSAFYRLNRVEDKVSAGEMTRGEEWTLRHKDFHIALVSGCGSERLTALCGQLFDQSERYRRLSASLRLKPRNTANEHKKIMEAALKRDSHAATLLQQHIERTTEHVVSAFRKSSI